MTIVQGDGAEEQVFTIDLERGVATQLTFDGIRNEFPLFSPARDRIALTSNIDGQWNLYVMPNDASSPPARLRQSERIQRPLSWSPDGRFLVYGEVTETEDFDLWVMPMRPDGGEPLSLATTPYVETDAAFSPDGRWIAYSSAESGRHEIYLKRFSQEEGGEEQRLQVSRDGGWQPAWSRDGRELFFRNEYGTALMVVDVSTGADLELGRARLLFEETEMPAPHRWGEATYDVAPDGRFLMLAEDRSKVITRDVVLNWFEELERLVPTES